MNNWLQFFVQTVFIVNWIVDHRETFLQYGPSNIKGPYIEIAAQQCFYAI